MQKEGGVVLKETEKLLTLRVEHRENVGGSDGVDDKKRKGCAGGGSACVKKRWQGKPDEQVVRVKELRALDAQRRNLREKRKATSAGVSRKKRVLARMHQKLAYLLKLGIERVQSVNVSALPFTQCLAVQMATRSDRRRQKKDTSKSEQSQFKWAYERRR